MQTQDAKLGLDLERKNTNGQKEHSNFSIHPAGSGELSLESSVQRPLNISSLTKNKPTRVNHAASFPARSRNSLEDNENRPFSPVAKSFTTPGNQREPRMVIQSPFFPNTASLQPISTFRTPRVPSPTKRYSAASIEGVLNASQAHTFTPGPLLVDERLTGSADMPQCVTNSTSSGNKGPQAASNQSEPFDDGTHAKVADDLGADGQVLGPNRYQPPPYDEGDENGVAGCYTKLPLRRVNKRIERTEDPDLQLDYISSKRYKQDDDHDVRGFFVGFTITACSHASWDRRKATTPPVVPLLYLSISPSIPPSALLPQ